MKKKIKNPKVVHTNGLRITIDPNLKPSPTTGNGLAARKLAKAIESFRKMKGLPKLSNE
jgi:hypothetical protein